MQAVTMKNRVMTNVPETCGATPCPKHANCQWLRTPSREERTIQLVLDFARALVVKCMKLEVVTTVRLPAIVESPLKLFLDVFLNHTMSFVVWKACLTKLKLNGSLSLANTGVARTTQTCTIAPLSTVAPGCLIRILTAGGERAARL